MLGHGDNHVARRAREVDTQDTHREDSTVAPDRVRRHAPGGFCVACVCTTIGPVRMSAPGRPSPNRSLKGRWIRIGVPRIPKREGDKNRCARGSRGLTEQSSTVTFDCDVAKGCGRRLTVWAAKQLLKSFELLVVSGGILRLVGLQLE